MKSVQLFADEMRIKTNNQIETRSDCPVTWQGMLYIEVAAFQYNAVRFVFSLSSDARYAEYQPKL